MSIEIRLSKLIEFGAEGELQGLSFDECEEMVLILEQNMTSVDSYYQMDLLRAHARLMRYLVVFNKEKQLDRSPDVLEYYPQFHQDYCVDVD